MKNLREEIEEMDNEYLQMIKHLIRGTEINIEILKNCELHHSLLGESMVIEDYINKMEVILKEKAIVNIARFQPAAKDLRKLVMYIDSVRLVERMGDLLKGSIKVIKEITFENGAVNEILKKHCIKVVEEVKEVLEIYVQALTTGDEKYLYMILAIDDSIDMDIAKIGDSIKVVMKNDITLIDQGTLLLLLIKKYERVSDHTTHLVHDLLYILKGENLRKKELERLG